MTIRNYILLGLAEYLAMAAGILLATSGREKLLAALIPLALVVPIGFLAYRLSVRRPPDHTRGVDKGAS